MRKIIISIILGTIIIIGSTGCNSNTKESSISSNVYLTHEKFPLSEVEITGNLSEPVFNSSILYVTNNKEVLRWGIKRGENNQTPRADPGAPELLKEYRGIYIGDTSKKEVYLTFDEGYENGYTGKILDVLKDNKVKAVFFITGPYLKEHQDLVRRMIEEGHIVGNHTINHPSLPEISNEKIEDEILGLDMAFKEKFGKNMKFLRPPKGEYSERTLAVTQKLGYINMFWSFAYDDWYRDKTRGVEYVRNILSRNMHNGAILLLHAVSKDNAESLDFIIKDAQEKGYEFGDPEVLGN